LDYTPYRADQVYGPGSIIEDVIRGIETAQIVIAEITPTNENVFYEVGYAHALKKPTILLANKDKKTSIRPERLSLSFLPKLDRKASGRGGAAKAPRGYLR
jgi:nucleoside 2-deoxyribosyltransferase